MSSYPMIPAVLQQKRHQQILSEVVRHYIETGEPVSSRSISRRHSELQKELGEVTPKALTATLRQLEYDGLVQRTVYPVVPPKVEYSLTALGKTLFNELDNLCKWAEKHQTDVEGARKRYKAST